MALLPDGDTGPSILSETRPQDEKRVIHRLLMDARLHNMTLHQGETDVGHSAQ